MSVIVQTIAGMLFPMVLIFSFYVILHGHLTPGGGFQGGAIGASAVALLIV
ncbi:MAG TPA: sodium:proton antiporter, partial [Thermoplasmatales archaeon]|nr:sodium:proton antiporter [Thermoplasmatales archaeon]